MPQPKNRGFFLRGIVILVAVLVATVTRLVVSNGAPSDKLFTP